MTQQHQLAPGHPPRCRARVHPLFGVVSTHEYRRSVCGHWLPADRFDELITCKTCLRVMATWPPEPDAKNTQARPEPGE